VSNTINLTLAGTYQLSIPGAFVDNNTSGELAIIPNGGNLTIQNTSGGAANVDGGHLDRVFDINPLDQNSPSTAVTVTFIGFGIENGTVDNPANPDGPASSGGGIRDQGNTSLTLTNMLVADNVASADGGGISMENTASTPWTLTIDNTSVGFNHAGDAGGGIETDGSGHVVINNGSLIYNNTCVNQGAGIWLDAIGVASANLNMTGAVVYNNTAQAGPTGAIGNAGNGAVTLTSSTFEGNFSGTTGGGFGDQNNLGTLSINNCFFQSNSSAGNGGAVQEGGPSTSISNSVFLSNSSNANGGAIFASGVTLTVNSSTFYSNSAATAGAGIELETTGTGANVSSIINCTIHRNDALNNSGANGGGIDAPATFTGSLNLNDDTIDTNFATTGGGIFYAGANGSSISMINTIVARNDAGTGPDAAGAFTDSGGNLIGISGAGSGNTGFGAATTQVGSVTTPLNPLLGLLTNNGGPTAGTGSTLTTPQTIVLPTESLLQGSPAIGHGLTAGAQAVDERGFAIPPGASIDIGAFQTTATAGANSANQRYINSLYMTLLKRPADAGAAGWVNLLNQGTPRTVVVAGIEASMEYRMDVVNGFYLHLLHRQADSGGLQVFVNSLAAGATYEQVEEVIISSGEYFQLHGSTNAGFVTGLYQDVLNRAPDSGGLANFTNALNNGASRAAIASNFYSSGEFMADLVAADYLALLGRKEDPTGAAGFLLALQTGATDQAVAAAILGSAEAFARRT
jgi:predicted outer membrane repeat protein